MKFIILGCGSSMGVPRPDGFFGNCDPKIKKNYRTRCSALLKTLNQNILIDIYIIRSSTSVLPEFSSVILLPYFVML